MIPGMALIEDQMSFYNVRRSGDSYNAATLYAAIQDIGDIECVAYLPKGLTDTQTIWTIDSYIDFPENITVFIPCGVVLNILSGQQVIFRGPLLTQCPIWRSGTWQAILLKKTAINSQSYRDFFDPFVVSGGYHGPSPTTFSPNFYTEAYVANGQYILEPTRSIDYGTLGANRAEDWVWVIISNFNTPNIPTTSFINVPGSHYYIDFTSAARPDLPVDSAYLMELHIINDTIDVVHDLRSYDAAQGLLNRIPMLPWTPQLVPGAYTYNIANGNYLNMGKVIYVTGYIDLTSIITIGSGPLFIHGLPYDYNVVGYVAGGFTFHLAGNIKPYLGPGSFSGFIGNGTNYITLVENIPGKPVTYVDASRVMPGMQLLFTGTYFLI